VSAEPEIQASPQHLDLDQFVHHTELPPTPFSQRIDAFIRRVGEATSWVWVALVAVITVNVVMRYVFGQGRIEFEELQWHVYAVGFLIGLSYCFEADDHVRIDVLYDGFNPRLKAWIEFLGILFFLLPFLAVILIYAMPFVAYSFSIHEVSEAPGGLPFRWAIKSFLLIGVVLLLLATVARFVRVTALLFGIPKAVVRARSE
jgi:TRAP-type mannitol/chloroaromatic compound transport system permease small subunit